MQHFSESVRNAYRMSNWYNALHGALTLPDIAAKLDGRQGGSAARYADWFNDYVKPKYTFPPLSTGDPQREFLNGDDCYALRCAYLHEGDFDLTSHHARDVLDRFEFVAPPLKGSRHCNLYVPTKMLQLQVDLFCEDICVSVEEWLAARGADPDVAPKLARLPTIRLIG